jgi:hypothetical protein
MSTSKVSYAAAMESLTITLTNVLAGAARQSTEVDNTVTAYLDLLLELSFTFAGAPAAGGYVEVFLACSGDGTFWPDAVTGADDAYTVGDRGRLISLGTVPCPAAGPNKSVWPTLVGPNAALVLPPFWAIVVVNNTNQTMNAGSVRFLGNQITEIE